jgi:GDPmannose 4,6-dehydratase
MMWMILQAEKAEDWVIATGVSTSVRDFVRFAFGEVGIELEFKGKGVHEKAYVTACNHKDFQIKIGKEVLSVDPSYFRPTEVDLLIGDPSKAKNKLGWVPEHDLASLVKDMMEGDVSLMKKDVILLKAGHEVLKQAE